MKQEVKPVLRVESGEWFEVLTVCSFHLEVVKQV